MQQVARQAWVVEPGQPGPASFAPWLETPPNREPHHGELDAGANHGW